jgi:transposase
VTKNKSIELARSYIEGESLREISRRTGLDRATVTDRVRKVGRKALQLYEAVTEVK